MLITRQLAVTTILVLSASFAGAEEAGSNLSRDEVDTLLKAHNGARKLVGAPAVKWSPELAGYAQQWADQIAASGKLEHRTEHKYGENLAAAQLTLSPETLAELDGIAASAGPVKH